MRALVLLPISQHNA